MVTSLWRELREGLHRYNRHASAAARLRMRIAVHEGQTYIADSGFAGDAINTVCRLCDCAEAKDALSASEGDLVLIVSDRIFFDVIRGYDAHDLPAVRLYRGHRDHAGQGLPGPGVHLQRRGLARGARAARRRTHPTASRRPRPADPRPRRSAAQAAVGGRRDHDIEHRAERAVRTDFAAQRHHPPPRGTGDE